MELLRKAIAKFVHLTDEEWELIVPHLAEKQLKKGELFAEEGKISREAGIVVAGSLRHYYTIDGEEKTTYFYFEEHLVASYISCITGKPSLLSVQALTDCSLIVFPYQKLGELFTLSHTWERFGRLLAEYLAIGLEERMAGLLMLSPEERYLQLLQSSKQKILERVPQRYIASYLGITPVSLSRIRSRIQV